MASSAAAAAAAEAARVEAVAVRAGVPVGSTMAQQLAAYEQFSSYANDCRDRALMPPPPPRPAAGHLCTNFKM